LVQAGEVRSIRVLLLLLGAALALAVTVVAPASLRCAQDTAPASPGKPLPTPGTLKEAVATMACPKADSKPSPTDQTKADVAELSTLADQLRDELAKMNVNVFSLDVLRKTEKVEQLAKKVKEEVHGR